MVYRILLFGLMIVFFVHFSSADISVVVLNNEGNPAKALPGEEVISELLIRNKVGEEASYKVDLSFSSANLDDFEILGEKSFVLPFGEERAVPIKFSPPLDTDIGRRYDLSSLVRGVPLTSSSSDIQFSKGYSVLMSFQAGEGDQKGDLVELDSTVGVEVWYYMVVILMGAMICVVIALIVIVSRRQKALK